MKLPRDLNGEGVVRGLRRVGYVQTRTKRDHVYMTTQENGEHHIAVPLDNPLKVGTLAAVLSAVAKHPAVNGEQFLRDLKFWMTVVTQQPRRADLLLGPSFMARPD